MPCARARPAALLAAILCLASTLTVECKNVQQFIDEAAPSGGIITLPALTTFSGAANCSSNITSSAFLSAAVTLQGAGATSTIIDCSDTALSCLIVTNVSVVITGIGFKGSAASIPRPPPFSLSFASTSQSSHSTSSSSPPPAFSETFSGRHNGRFDPLSILTHRLRDGLLFSSSSSNHASQQQSTEAADSLPYPFIGGCVFISGSPSASITACSFSQCVSAVGGGSIAAINCSKFQLRSSTFSDSLVLGATSTFAYPFRALYNMLGAFIIPDDGSVSARGGAVLVSPTSTTGSVVTINSCSFTRCRIFVSGAPVLSSLMGGAVFVAVPTDAAALPLQQGTSVTISNSTFVSCSSYIVASQTIAFFNLGGALAVQGFSLRTLSNQTTPYNTTTSQLQMTGLTFEDCSAQAVLNAAVTDSESVNNTAYSVGGSLFVMFNGPTSLSASTFQASNATIISNQSQTVAVPSLAIGGSIAVFCTSSTSFSDISVSDSSASVAFTGNSPSFAIIAMAGGIYWADLTVGYDQSIVPVIHRASFSNVIIAGSSAAIHTALPNSTLSGNYSCFGGAIAIVASYFNLTSDGLFVGHSIVFSNVSASRSSVVLSLQAGGASTARSSSMAPPTILLLGGAAFVYSSIPPSNLTQPFNLSISNSAFLQARTLVSVSNQIDVTNLKVKRAYIGGGALCIRGYTAVVSASIFAGNTNAAPPNNLLGFPVGGAVLVIGVPPLHSVPSDVPVPMPSNTHVSFTYCEFLNMNNVIGFGGALHVESLARAVFTTCLFAQNLAFVAGAVSSLGNVKFQNCILEPSVARVAAVQVYVSCPDEFICEMTFVNTTVLSLNATSSQALSQGEITANTICSFPLINALGWTQSFENSSVMRLTVDDARYDCPQTVSSVSIDRSSNDVASQSQFFNTAVKCYPGWYPSFSSTLLGRLPQTTLTTSQSGGFPVPAVGNFIDLLLIYSLTGQCVACAANTYTIVTISQYFLAFNTDNRAANLCSPCPTGANCIDPRRLNVTGGYYLWRVNLTHVIQNAVLLPPAYGSSGATSWTSPCAENSHRTGILCGQCEPGFGFRFFTTSCGPDTECNDAPWFVPVFFVCSAMLCVYFLANTAGIKHEPDYFAGVLQVLTFFFQIVSLLFSSYLAAFSSALTQFVKAFSFIASFSPSGSGSSKASGVCLVSGLTQKQHMAASAAFYAIIILEMAILSLLWPLIWPPLRALWNQIIQSAINVFRRSSSTRNTNIILQVPLTSTPAVDLSLNGQHQQQGGEGSPIVQFPPSLPLSQGRDPTAIKNASDGRGAAWLKLFLFVYINVVQLCVDMVTCIRLEDLQWNGQNLNPLRWWYDGSEECISSWQAAPIIFIVLLLLLPLAMITRCMWLRGRMWRLETGGIVCRGWFWENSYYQFYSLSFQEKAPHWLPFQLYQRIIILLIQLIPLPYWRMFASFIALCIFLLADVAIRPWQLADVQRLSTVSYCCLIILSVVLMRPATQFALRSEAVGVDCFYGSVDGDHCLSGGVVSFIVVVVLLPFVPVACVGCSAVRRVWLVGGRGEPQDY